jgi:hypothetical protein
VLEPEPHRVEPLPVKPEPGGELGVGAIGEVAGERMAQGAEVDADLVGAARLEVDVEQAGRAERLDDLVVGDAGLALVHHRELVVVARVAADGRVDGADHRVGQALHERVVLLVDVAAAEGLLEDAVGVLRLGHHHQPTGADVEPGHDALALAGPTGGDLVARGRESGDDGRTGPPDARVRRHAHRLVDHDDVVVVVDHAHAGHGLRDDLEARAGADGGQADLEKVTRAHPVGLARGPMVELDLPRLGEVGGLGPRHPEQPRQRRIQALALEPVGDEEGPLLSHRRPRDGPGAGACRRPRRRAGQARR